MGMRTQPWARGSGAQGLSATAPATPGLAEHQKTVEGVRQARGRKGPALPVWSLARYLTSLSLRSLLCQWDTNIAFLPRLL